MGNQLVGLSSSAEPRQYKWCVDDAEAFVEITGLLMRGEMPQANFDQLQGLLHVNVDGKVG